MPENQNKQRLLPPPVFWAQRKDLLYLMIALEDCKKPVIELQEDKLYYRGQGGTESVEAEVTLEFLKGIVVEESKFLIKGRGTEFVLKKKESGPYWQRLLKDKQKHHWLKVDFNKWKDEDESDGESNSDENFAEVMKRMSGLNNPGADLNDLEGEHDSDDEALPDLE